MTDWIVKENNYGWRQTFTLTKDGTAYNLTDYSAKLKVWEPGKTALKFSGDCIIDDDPTTGKCYYDVITTDFDTAGEFLGEIELTKTGEVLDTYTFTILVEPTAPPEAP